MNGQTETISVVVICRNARIFIEQCIESIRSQTLPADEIIVIDGHSTDGTWDWLQQQPDLHLILQEGEGIADARNTGIERSTGDLIAFLDADDFWPANKLFVQLMTLQLNPTLEAVTGYLQKYGEHNTRHLAMTPGGFLFRREVFERYGSFRNRWKVACDHEWFLRTKRLHMNTEEIPDVVVYKTMHGNNISVMHKKLYRNEMIAILREHHIQKNFP